MSPASFKFSNSTEGLSSNIQDDFWDVEASTSITPLSTAVSPCKETHSYIRPDRTKDSRAPCPGLNMLANHGYIHRSGRDITFFPLLRAIREVYNLSLPLALMLTLPGFLIYARFQWKWGITSDGPECESSSTSRPSRWSFPSISYTLTLSSLCEFGPGLKIAHRASLVHPDHPSQTPDLDMLWDFLWFARSRPQSRSAPSPSPELEKPMLNGGLSLYDLASVRVSREAALSNRDKLDAIHEQIALGESALTWLLFSEENVTETETSSTSDISIDRAIPLSFLAQWFGEERIPDGWVRPYKTVGLLDARKVADRVQKDMEVVSWTRG